MTISLGFFGKLSDQIKATISIKLSADEARPYLWDQTDVNVAEVFPFHFELELPEGLDEWHALDVSDRSSQLQTGTLQEEPRAAFKPLNNTWARGAEPKSKARLPR